MRSKSLTNDEAKEPRNEGAVGLVFSAFRRGILSVVRVSESKSDLV